MELIHAVRVFIERHQLVEPRSKIVVGVSGGPDSVTLLDVLQRLAEPYRLSLHVAHLHHGLRGDAADADLHYVTELAKQRELPITTAHVDVKVLARRHHLSVEEAARQARYGFLAQVACDTDARYVAVGHHADDQAETVLMHLLRGSGLAGLRGMLPSTQLCKYHILTKKDSPIPPDIMLIRPLLSVTRAEIKAYCEIHGFETRTDLSNFDTAFFRNRLRHEVLPYLRQFNPRISERLRNLAEIVREDYRLLEEFASVAHDTLLVAQQPNAFTYDLARWREQPRSIQRALIRKAAYRLRPTLRDIGFDHVERAVELAQRGTTGMQAVLPQGLRLVIGYTTLTIGDRQACPLPPGRPWLSPHQEVPIQVPGITELPSEWTLHVRHVAHWNLETIAENPNPLVAWMDRGALGTRPYLRTRLPGDRFRPHGLGGTEVRLSDFLINAKIPRCQRDHLPLLVGRDHTILWVVGIRLSADALISTRTQEVVYLRFRGP